MYYLRSEAQQARCTSTSETLLQARLRASIRCLTKRQMGEDSNAIGEENT